MMSTPSRASWFAISSFSCRLSEMPGDCSPSRNVVSKIFTWSGVPSAVMSVPFRFLPFGLLLVLRLRGRHALFPPEGEEEKSKGGLERHRQAQPTRLGEFGRERGLPGGVHPVGPRSRPACGPVERVFTWADGIQGRTRGSVTLARKGQAALAACAIALCAAPAADAAYPGANGRIAVATADGIATLNSDGSGFAQLTNGRDSDPAWSPDGSEIAFQRRADGSSDIYVMNADGSGPHAVTADA